MQTTTAKLLADSGKEFPVMLTIVISVYSLTFMKFTYIILITVREAGAGSERIRLSGGWRW